MQYCQETLINDCVNSVHCHPLKPIIGTSIGQRHFYNDDNISTTESDSERNNNNNNNNAFISNDTKTDSYESLIQFWKLNI